MRGRRSRVVFLFFEPFARFERFAGEGRRKNKRPSKEGLLLLYGGEGVRNGGEEGRKPAEGVSSIAIHQSLLRAD
jgi:hypothetical protein